MGKLIHGVGINDADYVTQQRISGKWVMCPFYQTWKAMLERCYSEKYKTKRPTYENCYVIDEWLTFSSFKAWMQQQDWKGNELDKDLLFIGNKVYSPINCVFISQITNGFITDCGAARGDYPIGVHWDARDEKFRSQCRNPFTNKKEGLGYFACQNQAHQAWRKRKNELANQLADLQSDIRVATALRLRYA